MRRSGPHLPLLVKGRGRRRDDRVLDEPDPHNARRPQLLVRSREGDGPEVKGLRGRGGGSGRGLGELEGRGGGALVEAEEHTLDLTQLGGVLDVGLGGCGRGRGCDGQSPQRASAAWQPVECAPEWLAEAR
jgi:hypothetical protein